MFIHNIYNKTLFFILSKFILFQLILLRILLQQVQNCIIKNNLNGVVVNNSSFAVLVAKINFIANNYYKFSKNGLLMSRKFDVTESCSKFWNFITNANYYFRKKKFFIQ